MKQKQKIKVKKQGKQTKQNEAKQKRLVSKKLKQ